VLAAESGATALATWDEHQGKIDLVLTDLVMPGGIHGRELAARLGARTAALRLIFITGHARDLDLGTQYAVLHKPVDPDQLLRVIRSSFDQIST
jgi:CheY-like chemotaxis protein